MKQFVQSIVWKPLSFGLALLALSAVLGLRVYQQRASAAGAATPQAPAAVEYAFSSNGIMLGTEPSPLQFVQATRSNGGNLPVNGTFTGSATLLAGVGLRVKNAGNADIRAAKLVVDFIDARSNRIVGQICDGGLENLPIGAERSVAVLSNSAESLNRAIAEVGGAVRVLVRVDLVELTNATSWKYGLIHQQDPNNPNRWVPVVGTRISQLKSQVKAQPAKFSPTTTAFACGYFHGYEQPNGVTCGAPCYCTLTNENWSPINNGVGPAEYGPVPMGCGTRYPSQCQPCTKIGYVAAPCL